jgi:hypothetical protein
MDDSHFNIINNAVAVRGAKDAPQALEVKWKKEG